MKYIETFHSVFLKKKKIDLQRQRRFKVERDIDSIVSAKM